MSVPTSGETFAKMTEYVRKAQECAAMLSHLDNANNDRVRAMQWLAMSENFKRIEHVLRQLATGRLN